MQVFFEAHQDIPREGPGSNEATRKAFSMLEGLPENPLILDVGCGPGLQTIELAKISNAKIIAVDNHNPFLDNLNENAVKEGVSDKITTANRSMYSLMFNENFFDVIWSEGAIYIIGFEKGIKEWSRFIKEGGYLVVSEISWLTRNPPEEPKRFWNKAYPAMKTIDENLAVIENLGLSNVGHFVIPESAWWDGYYTPLEARVKLLKGKYAEDEQAIELLDSIQSEINLYRNYSDSYGYVFYLIKKS